MITALALIAAFIGAVVLMVTGFGWFGSSTDVPFGWLGLTLVGVVVAMAQEARRPSSPAPPSRLSAGHRRWTANRT